MAITFQRVFNVRRAEVLPVAFAIAFFFCVLTALMMLRPAREALGMRGGLDTVRWLFVGTAIATLLVNPVFSTLVSRFRRIVFISATYLFFAASLAVFYLLIVLTPEVIGLVTGQVFYVWFSVFNLFSSMVFWALMSDRFSLEQSKRFFALIAVGGTLGAIFGPWLASVLAAPLGTASLLLVSSGFLILALCMAGALVRVQPAQATQGTDGRSSSVSVADDGVIGGGAWDGIKAVFQSRYLLGIAAYVVILAIMATFLYFIRLQMVAALGDEVDRRTTLFAQIDLITQVATLVIQVLVSGHLMKRLGVHITLALLPITALFGFVGLALVGSLAALIVFESAFRAVQRAIMRPARETLFTVVSPEEKYKAKAFVDTFVYRAGDVTGAQLEGALGRLGIGLAAVASVAVPLAMVWAALALWLGRTQQRMAAPDLPSQMARDLPSSL
ncbi:NTP/NDP exchange transporter [Allopusillimonas ginsengisoli]|uniref:NTP/NDP exchange transporter n=1 Tax=Allopusillimonas ginsengisoli TaxID=453575 RepID=UPI00101EF96E|nr:MFS transporter [Allopusillimonas ginsengisoli]TEA77726.1 MFS transporter [Allopusillimonas ginsengisoli]